MSKSDEKSKGRRTSSGDVKTAPAPDKNRQGSIVVDSVVPKNRQDLLKWNGWGYRDSEFALKNGCVYFTGRRYALGGRKLPRLNDWSKGVFNVDLPTHPRKEPKPMTTDDNKYPEPRIAPENLDKIARLNVDHSTKGIDRLIRAHGQTLHEIYTVKYLDFERIPDVVVWPKCHDDVVRIVRLADEEDLVVIPYGGGTAVSGAVECPTNEFRTIVSLDTSQMNRILWLDKENLVACCESGIIGQDLERELGKLGYTSGHEPDSYEFSSLGGWVATRASGMKKNTYGNIEDLLVHAKMVTPKGVLQKNCRVPRMSAGPDFNHLILGSEGSLGVITEVIIKVRPLPKCVRYGSIVMPDFRTGIKCMREVARQRCQPSSIRLMDNKQFKIGFFLKPEPGYVECVVDGLKKFYVTKIKGYDPDRMCVITLLFEGEEHEVKEQERRIYAIGAQFGGMSAGEDNGKRGYLMTFLVAYIRDLALEYGIAGESFETSIPWDRAETVCDNVIRTMTVEFGSLGIKHFEVNCRLTQTYDAGCVIYFYFAFNYLEVGDDPIEIQAHMETKARDEILACGGSISHHHGVGKMRKKWYPTTVSAVGVDLYKATKNHLDPKNIFAVNNFVPQSKL